MVATTDDGDDRPKGKTSNQGAFVRALQAAEWATRRRLTDEEETRQRFHVLLEASAATHSDHQVVQAAGEVNNVFISPGPETQPQPEVQQPSLAERRQEFHFDVLKLKMNHAQWMIFISVFAVAVGVVALVAGVVMALADTGSPHGYVTGASGLAASLGGGALHRHAKRAMADLTKAAERNEEKIDADHELEIATTLIDRVQDQAAKDRLNSAAAMKALKIQPDPETMVTRLLPGNPPKEIEPGESDR